MTLSDHESQTKIKERILQELKRGDRFASELKDALNLKRYPDLWMAISTLESEGKIEHYFKATQPSATLTYRLLNKPESPKPMLFFQR